MSQHLYLHAKRKYVHLTAVWGNDDVDVHLRIPLADWAQIVKRGKQYRDQSTYWYEGKRFTANWSFNAPSRGSLVVTYDDGGEGFIGEISEAEDLSRE